MTIVEFLRQRLDEEEAAAKVATPGPWQCSDAGHEVTIEGVSDGHTVAEVTICLDHEDRRTADARHIAGHDPARVLRDVEAKRRIIDRAEFVADHGPAKDDVRALDMSTGASAALDDVLRHLALPYWDHPDYDPAWG